MRKTSRRVCTYGGRLRSFVSSTTNRWDDGEEDSEGGLNSGASECSGLAVGLEQGSGLGIFDALIGDLVGGRVKAGSTEDRSGWGL